MILLQEIYDTGLGQSIYTAFHVLGCVSIFFFNAWYGKKYGLKIWQSIVATAIVYSITYLWIHVQYWMESGFKVFGPKNMVRGFVYIPLFTLLAARLLKISWARMCDFIAPCVCISLGISRIGCIFTGCCRGYACSWGIYNPKVHQILFPVQLLEIATVLVIVVYILLRAKKRKFDPDGLSFPVMLLCYGSTRFLWEFARDNEKLLWGCSSLSFHALFMTLVGLAVIVYSKRRGKLRI